MESIFDDYEFKKDEEKRRVREKQGFFFLKKSV